MILLVIRAANLLEVNELQLFDLAHRFWHHHSADPRQIYAVFTNYLNTKIAPPWVVHFSRSVLRAYNTGTFEPVDFGIYPTYEKIPLGWSLAFHTPLSMPLNNPEDLLVA